MASVAYVDVGGSKWYTLKVPPLKNLCRFLGGETIGSDYLTGYELQRSIFALTNRNTAPPITTDSEYIWKFDKLDDDHIQGKLRIARYLNANSDTITML